MSKICKSCGSYYDGEYCPKCGYGKKDIKSKTLDKYKKSTEPKGGQVDIYHHQNSEEAKAKHKKSSVVTVIGLAVIVIAIVVGGLFLFGTFSRQNKTDVVTDYFKAINTRDFDLYIKNMPSAMKNDYENDRELTGYTKKEYMDKFAEDFVNEYGSGFIITAKCGKEKKIDDYNTDEYEKTYGSVPKISEAYVISTTLNIKGSKKDDTIHMECYVGKVYGKWKLFNMEQVAGKINADGTIGTDTEQSSDIKENTN
ncbi:MAG: hypothetical protein ACI4RC_01985 [Oscillospiraceae bacterium]